MVIENILRRKRISILHLLRSPLENDFPSGIPGIRTKIYNPVRCPDDILIMLHHHY